MWRGAGGEVAGVSIFLAGSVPGGGGSGARAWRKSGISIYPIFFLKRY